MHGRTYHDILEVSEITRIRQESYRKQMMQGEQLFVNKGQKYEDEPHE
jgi:hypothetical protein